MRTTLLFQNGEIIQAKFYRGAYLLLKFRMFFEEHLKRLYFVPHALHKHVTVLLMNGCEETYLDFIKFIPSYDELQSSVALF